MKMVKTMILALVALGANLSFAYISYPYSGYLPPVSKEAFEQLDIRMGTVRLAELNKKAKVPSMRLEVDFGPGFEDLIQTSAQLLDNYYPGKKQIKDLDGDGRPKAMLEGMQVAAITNFPLRRIGIPSYFLTLGGASFEGETTGVVVLQTAVPSPNGARVKLLNDGTSSYREERLEKADYSKTFEVLDIRVGTVISPKKKLIDFGMDEGQVVSYRGDYPSLSTGMRVLRVVNLEGMEDQDNLIGVVDEAGEKIPLILERSLPNGRFVK
jgi:tRNA-binding protein